MSATTKINWTDVTWNPVTGCTPAGVGCAHCYAARMAERFPAVHGVEFSSESLTSTATCPVPFSRVICHPERMGIPEHWRKPRAIMCPSMGDLFHSDVPSGFIRDVLGVMDRCLQHTFIVLTKRPERSQEVLGNWTKIPNMVLGVSCSTQAEADHAIPILLNTQADRRIVSLEPLVGPVSLNGYLLSCRDCSARGMRMCGDCKGSDREAVLDGVIVGGESGPGARPMHPDWVMSLRDQCEDAGVPFFFKQWGEWGQSDYPSYTMFDATQAGRLVEATCVSSTDKASRGRPRFYPIPTDYDGKPVAFHPMVRVGRSRAGRLLDGRTHDELCWDVAGKGEA